MNTVGSINVSCSSRSEHGCIPLGLPNKAMRGWIISSVSFRFHDDTARLTDDQGCTNKIPCDLHRIA